MAKTIELMDFEKSLTGNPLEDAKTYLERVGLPCEIDHENGGIVFNGQYISTTEIENTPGGAFGLLNYANQIKDAREDARKSKQEFLRKQALDQFLEQTLIPLNRSAEEALAEYKK